MGHPRLRLVVFAIVGLALAGLSRAGDEARPNAALADGTREAEISQGEELDVPPSLPSKLAMRYFFDQL